LKRIELGLKNRMVLITDIHNFMEVGIARLRNFVGRVRQSL
jgi:hypothetical protein